MKVNLENLIPLGQQRATRFDPETAKVAKIEETGSKPILEANWYFANPLQFDGKATGGTAPWVAVAARLALVETRSNATKHVLSGEGEAYVYNTEIEVYGMPLEAARSGSDETTLLFTLQARGVKTNAEGTEHRIAYLDGKVNKAVMQTTRKRNRDDDGNNRRQEQIDRDSTGYGVVAFVQNFMASRAWTQPDSEMDEELKSKLSAIEIATAKHIQTAKGSTSGGTGSLKDLLAARRDLTATQESAGEETPTESGDEGTSPSAQEVEELLSQ